jgi:transposase
MDEERADGETSPALRTDRRGRRRYTERFKCDLVALCSRPGVSVSGLAVERGLNPNLVRKWMRDAGLARSAKGAPALLPVAMSEPPRMVAKGTLGTAAAVEIRMAEAVITIGQQASASQIEAIVRALR